MISFARPSDRDPSVEEVRQQTKRAQDWLDGRFVDQPAYPITYDGPPIVMRVTGHPPPTASAVVRVFKPAFAVLTRMTRSKIVVEDHWGATVHSDREGVAALRDGRSDLAPCYSGWDRRAYPLAQALQLPGLFPSSELATTIAEELYSRYFRADVERQGILMGRLKATGAFHLFSLEPIRTLAQFKGLRVGTSEGVDMEVFRLLGAVPVSMSSLETKQALASGRIDAMHLPDGPAEVFGINEIARFRTGFGLLRHNVEYGMSAKFWRALPVDLQPVLNAWLRAEAQAETQIFYGLAGSEARERFRAAGMQFLALSDDDMTECAERLRPITDSFIESEEKQGRPARALINDIAALRRKYAGKSAADLMREAIESPIETINPISAK